MSALRTLAGVAASVALVASASAQTLQLSSTNVLGIDDVEITPDQRYAVVRQNRSDGYVRVYDLSTGALASAPPVGNFNILCGEVLDAVAVTNDRAVVLGGVQCAILDLNNLANPVMAEPMVGYRPNDVAITPDGTIAVVRGGNSFEGGTAGTYIFELATATQIGYGPGDAPIYTYAGPAPYSFNTDSVAVTNRHAVVLSLAGGLFSPNPRTRVTIWDLHPAGGAPAVILETSAGAIEGDLRGAPHDVAISPDGQHAVVRSEQGLGVWSLNGGSATRLFAGGLSGNPGPFEDTALDSVEVTDALAVTLANVANAPQPETQVEVVTWAGVHHSGRIPGLPHDLAVTADGTRALVRTGAGVALYDLMALPPSGALVPADWIDAPSATSGFQSGLDSVAVSDEFAVTLTHEPNLQDTRAWFWSIARGRLELLSSTLIPNSRPTDVVITPDARRAVVTGTASISVFHLGSGGRAFEHHPVGPNAFYQWCDGVAASADHAVGIGQYGSQAGWIDLVRTAPFATRYCTALPNSTGRVASILAMGDASVAHNSLKLCVDGAPARARGRFVYGPTQVQLPFGDGVQCVGGQTFNLRVFETNLAGSGFREVDYTAQTIPAGIVLPGSTWNYQFLFLDRASSGFGFNSSDALSIVFTP